MFLVCIFQSWSIDDGIARANETKQKGEGGTDTQRGAQRGPECIDLYLHMSAGGQTIHRQEAIPKPGMDSRSTVGLVLQAIDLGPHSKSSVDD